MIRRPPRSTLDRSSAASDVYKRQELLVEVAVLAVLEDGVALVGDLAEGVVDGHVRMQVNGEWSMVNGSEGICPFTIRY